MRESISLSPASALAPMKRVLVPAVVPASFIGAHLIGKPTVDEAGSVGGDQDPCAVSGKSENTETAAFVPM